jgi:5-methyltetrahydrofolate--homocysteine methyltransferase
MPNLNERERLIFDGACGTNLQSLAISASEWAGREGCNEWLNLASPRRIEDLHASFYEAGAEVVETNTFGASRVVLSEYGLEDRVEAINRAAVENARRAAAGQSGRFVAGSVGPGTKLVSLGQIAPDALRQSCEEQIRVLVDSGVDLLLLETCQDLLQVKIALIAARDVMAKLGREVPVMVSLTIEQTGTMLVGTDLAAAAAALEPFPLMSLGLNCATGPADMVSSLQGLNRLWPGRISCMPNQGLPKLVDGRTHYPLSPDAFAAHMVDFVRNYRVSFVGGCCGTTPEHIRVLTAALRDLPPAPRAVPEVRAAAASLYQAVELLQDPPPLLIGERTNANGSRKFRECLLKNDYDACLQIGLEQEAAGAHLLDVCAAFAGRDETADLLELVRRFAASVKIPLMIDSTSPASLEACLREYPGRAVVNSIHLEDGGQTLRRVCPLLKRYGAAVVALTIHEQGMAMTADDKVETARRIHRIAVEEFGLRPRDILFDALTFTLGAGDETLRDAAVQTLEAIRRIKAELPGVRTVLGISNISFGLSPRSRRVLNSVFLHEAVLAGLDAAIVDAGKVLPLNRIPAEDREVCLDLLYDRTREPGQTALMRFIRYFQDRVEPDAAPDAAQNPLPEAALARLVVEGSREGLEDALSILLARRTALSCINDLLVPAMRHVGELFGRGELLLPFVLKSAEVMKAAVGFLEPHLDRTASGSVTKILLATVQGDVHDIGKNLVDIILTNNGYKVYNLGIKVPASQIIEKAREYQVDLIGLSGLLVKSAIVMKESLPQYEASGLRAPILLGGAALTGEFVAKECAPAYGAPVVYCADAFAGLSAVRAFEAGHLVSTEWNEGERGAAFKPGPRMAGIERGLPPPAVPFLGARIVEEIDPALLFPLINEQALFRGRWGYRRAALGAEEYEVLLRDRVRPLYEELKRSSVRDGLLRPRAAYGYFCGWSEGDTLCVEADGRVHRFVFPRQTEPPHLCIADFYRSREEGGDVVGFFVVTIGPEIDRATHALYEANQYHDYLMLHGFSVEVTDALAELWHQRMRREMGIGGSEPENLSGFVTQTYQGSRYGFGYPACPDLEAHRAVFELLRPERIGVTLTESMEMVPEQSTSAIVAHHPQAKYFAV